MGSTLQPAPLLTHGKYSGKVEYQSEAEQLGAARSWVYRLPTRSKEDSMWTIEHEKARIAFEMRQQATHELLRAYHGKPCVCSECFEVQVFEVPQCAGCHSEFGATCWPYNKAEELREDSMNRAGHLSQDLLDELDAAERGLTHLSVEVWEATQAR